MVCINRKQNGGGVLDSLMRPFTVSKYGQEMHSRSLDPNHFLQGYNYVGPRSELLLREKLGDDKPLNDLDATAKQHDYAYLREKQEYEKDHNKQKHMKNVWHADDVFIEKARNSRNDPVMGKIASKLIATKEGLEKAGVMDTKQFTGFGAAEEEEIIDPVARLRSLVQSEYKTEKKDKNKKLQKGGILPALIPIGIAIGSALAGKITSDVYDFIKKKVTGGSYKMPIHKTKKEKVDFLKEFVNSIN